MRRLFIQHLGATPSAIAHTRRLHFAKKLIDETSLSMTQIAFAAGFGCVRRFNENIRKTYHRTPTQIRRLARQKSSEPENQYVFRLNFRPPYHWDSMMRFLALRATPRVESVNENGYCRTISLNGSEGYFAVSLDKANDALIACVQFDDPHALFLIVDRIRAMFDVNADWTDIGPCLRADAALAGRVTAAPGIRIPGCWDGFELAVRAILGQQISVRAATTLAGRLVTSFGRARVGTKSGCTVTHIFPSAETLCEADLASIGLTAARANTIRALARAVCHLQIRFEGVTSTEEFSSALCAIPGIGAWTAQYIAMRALGDPDAFPSGDIALLRALDLHNARELERRAESWRPWRAYAAIYLWGVPSPAVASRKAPLASRKPLQKVVGLGTV